MRALLLALSMFVALSITMPVFAIVPEVRNVTVYTVNGNTYLNVTVYHTPEISTHYVNIIEVTFGENTTDLTIGVQTLAPDDTFTVQYDVGPVSETPTADVKAHCIVNGWSVVDWTGVIPEFPVQVLLMGLISVISVTVLAFRKIRTKSRAF
jgi:hypothetical protein